MVMLLGLELRHHSLRHVLALLLTFALASLCWCCWKRHRSFHRHRRDLLLHHHHHRAAAGAAPPTAVSSSVSPASATVSVLPPAPAAVIPPLPFRRFRPVSAVSAVSFPPGPGPGPEKSEEQLDPLIKNSDCPICLCAFETDVLLVVLPSCDHAYHPSCIHRWLQSHTDCPICRSEIPHL